MKDDLNFLPGSVYYTRGACRYQFYLYVERLALSGRALRGIVFDRSYGVMGCRWFAIREGICLTNRSDISFSPEKEIFTDSTCFPPSEVLECFRFQLGRGSSSKKEQ